MKDKKIIIASGVILVVLVIVIAIAATSGKGKKAVTQDVTTVYDGTNFWDTVDIFEGDGDIVEFETVTDEAGEVVTDESGESATVAVVNGGGNEQKTDAAKDNDKDKNKDKDKDTKEGNADNKGGKDDDSKESESMSEEYPGQNDGWSPIVRPEDLNN